MLIDDLNIRVLNHNTGTLIRKLTLDYPALAASNAETHPKQNQGVNHVSGHLSTMSRDMTSVAGAGFEPA